jgi:hypothetical protein
LWTYGFSSFLPDSPRFNTTEPSEYAHHIPAWLGDYVAKILKGICLSESELAGLPAGAEPMDTAQSEMEPAEVVIDELRAIIGLEPVLADTSGVGATASGGTVGDP